jgi:hypothetical protein
MNEESLQRCVELERGNKCKQFFDFNTNTVIFDGFQPLRVPEWGQKKVSRWGVNLMGDWRRSIRSTPVVPTEKTGAKAEAAVDYMVMWSNAGRQEEEKKRQVTSRERTKTNSDVGFGVRIW